LRALSNSNHRFIVPTIVLLEVDFLIAIDRVRLSRADLLAYLQTQANTSIVDFDTSVWQRTQEVTTRDLFDRIIVATALAHRAKLITKDTWMHEAHASLAVW
jgi:PIN domain nuclease of toxin-antitoxin system